MCARACATGWLGTACFDDEMRGRGLFIGLDCAVPEHGNAVIKACFERGLIMETTGQGDRVVTLMPPLITSDADLDAGLDILEEAMQAVVS